MDLLWRANFRTVFVGIESPRKNSLLETRKVQNVRGDSIASKLDRLRENGILVYAGFVVGFDNDDERVFDEMFDFIQDNGVGIAIVSILSPIPSTPLHARLAQEGRLVSGDPLVWFEPKLMTRATLRERYHELNRRLFSPEAFFARVLRGYSSSADFRDALSRRSGAHCGEPRRATCRDIRDADAAPSRSRRGGTARRLRQDLSCRLILPKSERWGATRCPCPTLSLSAFGSGIITRSQMTAKVSGEGPAIAAPSRAIGSARLASRVTGPLHAVERRRF